MKTLDEIYAEKEELNERIKKIELEKLRIRKEHIEEKEIADKIIELLQYFIVFSDEPVLKFNKYLDRNRDSCALGYDDLIFTNYEGDWEVNDFRCLWCDSDLDFQYIFDVVTNSMKENFNISPVLRVVENKVYDKNNNFLFKGKVKYINQTIHVKFEYERGKSK